MSIASRTHPRRRAAPKTDLDCSTEPPCLRCDKGMSLRKGSTFHSPPSPSSPLDDPILSIRSLPSRSLTCPKTLEDLIQASEKRVHDILESFDRSYQGFDSNIETDLAHQDVLPVPSFLLAHAASHSDLMDLDNNDELDQARKPKKARIQFDHHHGSDSGLGTSVASKTIDARSSSSNSITESHRAPTDSTKSVYSAVNGSLAPSSLQSHILGERAIKQIQLHIVQPILKEQTLKEYHPLVKDIPHRIGERAITCLRDLEKTLIFLAPVSVDFSHGEGALAHCFLSAKTKASSASSYLNFCETSIQCIHTTVDYLSETDQRRPTDRPYTNTYFVDLVEQVRAYARIMAVSRQKKAKGQALNDSDHVPGEKIVLRGGVNEDGKPAELVREKDGQVTAITAGHNEIEMDLDEDDSLLDDDVRRSMARKRKCDQGKVDYRACRECGKVYTRPCDLTKHEKTHSRPWKCTFSNCKYFELGWPTEKERDRHVNDRHSSAPALYRCLYKDCTYTSKRESNCKQHMEKTHGWEYVRSKSTKGQKLVPTTATPSTPLMPTPSSADAFPNLSTPGTSANTSPANQMMNSFSPMDPPHQAVSMDNSTTSLSNIDLSGVHDPSFDFTGFDYNLNNGSNFVSPEMGGDRRDSSGNGFSPSSVDSSLPSSTFEDTFNFGQLNYDWAPMGDIFTQYNFPDHVQQPTPAWSDNQWSTNGGTVNAQGNIGFPALSPGAHADITFSTPQDNLPSNGVDGFADFASAHAGQNPNDFTLFGADSDKQPAEGSAEPEMFPNLDSIGNQFTDVDMDFFNSDFVDGHFY